MLQHRLGTARFFSCSCGVWDFGVMASRGSVFWVLSALTLCSKFVGGTALEARLGWDGLDIRSTTAESTHTNSVADQLPAFDESLYEWETLTSKNGAPFRVGRKKAPVAKPFSKDVYWPVDGQWKPTSNDVSGITGITFVRVFDSGIPGATRYTLQFSTRKTFDYSFQTKTGESFDVPTAPEGLNIVQYDAKDPTIVKVTGN